MSFYANMTAIQPIMDVFNAETGLKGKYTRISTSKFLATVLTEFQAGKLMADVLQAPLPVMQMLKAKGVLAPIHLAGRGGLPRLDPQGRPDSDLRHRVCGPDLQQGTGQAGGCSQAL